MSKHSAEYLHENERVGFGRKAWWFSSVIEKALKAAGKPASHYTKAVPLAEVRRLLGSVKVTSGQLFTTYTDANGEKQSVQDTDRQVILNAATGDIFGVFKQGSEWPDHTRLVDSISALVGGAGDLGIQTCGLLDFGARAYVSVGIPSDMTIEKVGITYRPNLIAAQALDGSLSETYMRTITVPLCDNTLSACLSESGDKIKVKHTKNASLKIKDAREALDILAQTADTFSAEVIALSEMKVTDKKRDAVLDVLIPMPTEEGRGLTMATNKRDAILALLANDPRVSPWAGTGWGMVQAFNTYGQHVAIRRGAGKDESAVNAVRFDRNMRDVLTGKTQESDLLVVETLTKVLSNA